MPTYVYETLGKRPKRYEIRQGIKDAPLTCHPETGEPIKRVLAGGSGIITRGKNSNNTAPCGAPPSVARHCCGAGRCCH